MSLLLLFAVLLLAIFYVRRRNRRAMLVAGVAKLFRLARVSAGSYRLADVAEQMVELALGTAVPSVTRTYLPQTFRFGVSLVDATRWDALLCVLGEEVAELVAERGRERNLTLAGRLKVTFEVRSDVSAGRPVLVAAAMRRGESSAGNVETVPMVAVK